MSITNALTTGVSGLSANSARVGEISSNIANASTVGYRRTFASFVTQNASDDQLGVRAVTKADINANGILQATGRDGDFAISGEGFMMVSRNVNDPVESNYFLTRAGSFSPDADGNMRNSAGYYLNAFPVGADGTVGPVDRNSVKDLETVNVGNFQVPGTPSSMIGVSGNVPSQQTGVATPGDPFVSTMRYVNQLGGTDVLNLSWQPTSNSSEWTLNITDTSGADYGNATVTFNDSGTFAGSPASYVSNGLPVDPASGVVTLTIANGTTPQTLELDLGAPGTFGNMTQFSGDYTPPVFDDNGSESGSLIRAELAESGTLFGVFDNGQRRALFEVPLATVINPNEMRSVDGNAYVTTQDSGAFQLTNAGQGTAGSFVSGALEASNVDIAQELTDLITTQRAYSSNAKIVTTADEMLDETLRLKR